MKLPNFKQLKLKNKCVLFLGSGKAEHVFRMAEDFHIVAVDIDKEAIFELQKHPKIEAILRDIRKFEIKKNKYGLIVARHVLPFIDSKEEIYKIIDNMFDGIVEGGFMVFTLFGEKDGFPNSTKFTKDEINLIRYKYPTINFETQEGISPRDDGQLKNWEIYQFTIHKPAISSELSKQSQASIPHPNTLVGTSS